MDGVRVKLGKTIVVIGGEGGKEVSSIHFIRSHIRMHYGCHIAQEIVSGAYFEVGFLDGTKVRSKGYDTGDEGENNRQALEAIERFKKLIGWKDVCDEAHIF